jgi:site-specific recombinase XerD
MTQLFKATDLPQGMDKGPLSCITPAYAALLARQGYSKQSARLQLCFLRDLNQWLNQQQLQVSDLSEPTIHRYMRSRHQRFRPRRDDASTLSRIVNLLNVHGILPKKADRPSVNPHQRIEDDYDRYLIEQRGLAATTRTSYRSIIRKFLSDQFGDGTAIFTDLTPDNVVRFIRHQSARLSPKHAGLVVCALRSFLRYLRYQGSITTDLAACVPPIANWKLSALPKFLQPGQVQRVLSQCDRGTVKGRRDYAILLLLARLGLRACEIVSLTLDDIHWKSGEIHIQGKGNQPALLPLPSDVGQAIAVYLEKDRPFCPTRRVFIRMKAPLRGFANSCAISTIVARTLKRAGIESPYTGAHLFRHTLATQMLRQGAKLADIAVLLRHHSINTTAIYAKVDLTALRTIAQPWPGGAK